MPHIVFNLKYVFQLTQRLSTIRKSSQFIQVDVSAFDDENAQCETDVRILKEKCKLIQAQIANLSEDTHISRLIQVYQSVHVFEICNLKKSVIIILSEL